MPCGRILYVITKLELGGAQLQLLSLLRKLSKDKYDVSLFTASEGLLHPDFAQISNLKIRKSRFLERPIHPLKDLLAFFELTWFIRKNNIKIVHTHSSKAGIVGRLAAFFAGARIIVHTVHGWSFNSCQSALLRSFYIFLEKICASVSERIIVVSWHDMEKGLTNGIGHRDKYALVHYAIEPYEYCSQGRQVREALSINPEDLAVGMVACLKPQKAPLDFVQLAAALKDDFPHVRFILTGDGVLSEAVKASVRKFGIEKNFLMTGWRRDIPELLAGLDVFVLTSLWEGLPITVMEAMASSLPVIATDTGGIREIIEDGVSGYLVKPGDMQAMAGYLRKLLSDAHSRKMMGAKAKSKIGPAMNVSRMAAQTLKVYTKKYPAQAQRRGSRLAALSS